MNNFSLGRSSFVDSVKVEEKEIFIPDCDSEGNCMERKDGAFKDLESAASSAFAPSLPLLWALFALFVASCYLFVL